MGGHILEYRRGASTAYSTRPGCIVLRPFRFGPFLYLLGAHFVLSDFFVSCDSEACPTE
jgi:hypothetical protein